MARTLTIDATDGANNSTNNLFYTTYLPSGIYGHHGMADPNAEIFTGHNYRTEYKNSAGAIVRTLASVYDKIAYGNGVNFVYLSRKDDTVDSKQSTTTYLYDAAKQGGTQYGNLTDVYEWGEADPAAGLWYRHTEKGYYPRADESAYIVGKPGYTNVFENNGSNGNGDWKRQTWYCYDGSVLYSTPPGTRGLLTATRLALNGTDLLDVSQAYDSYGNRTSSNEHAQYGSAAALGGTLRTTSFAYDTDYQAFVVSETNPLGHVTGYLYDYVLGRPTRITDPNGAVTAHGYDPLGRKIASWLPGDDPNEPGAASIIYRYLSGGGLPFVVQTGRRKDAGGGTFGRRSYQWQIYDGLGRLIQTQSDFDRSAQRIRAVDVNEMRAQCVSYGSPPGFNDVTTGVDTIKASHFVGLRTSVQSLWNSAALGALPTWSSNKTPGGPSLATSPTPIFGSDLVDLRGWLNRYESKQALPLTAFAYEAGMVVAVNRFYNSRGLLDKESVPHVRALKVPGQFDSADWSPAAHPATAYLYDDGLNRETRRTSPGGEQANTSYVGWTTSVVDPLGHKKAHTKDAFGRLAKVEEFTGTGPHTLYAATSYAYDLADQLVKVYDATNHDASGNLIQPPAGNIVTIAYDKLGRKIDLYDPDLGHWHYDYHPIGTLQYQTDAKGQVLTFEYDGLKRLRFKKNGAASLVEFVYDETAGGFAGYSGQGRRTTMKWGSGLLNTLKSYYDGRGRAARTEITFDGVPAYILNATYDDLDRVLALTLPNNEVLKYTYGDHGLPVALESSMRGKIVTNAIYNAMGRLYDLTLGNGLAVNYRYWGLDYQPPLRYGMLRSIVAGARQNINYDYFANGNISWITDNRTAEVTECQYDDLDRLTLASCPGQFSESYVYDPAGGGKIGNMTSKAGASRTFPSAGQARPHAPLLVGGNGYGYDANGNLLTAEGRTYDYDVENRLVSVTESSPIRAMTYDGDGGLRTLAESGVPARRYISPEYEVNPTTGEIIVHYPFGGRRIATAVNGSLRYLLADHLGSTHAEVGIIASRRMTIEWRH